MITDEELNRMAWRAHNCDETLDLAYENNAPLVPGTDAPTGPLMFKSDYRTNPRLSAWEIETTDNATLRRQQFMEHNREWFWIVYSDGQGVPEPDRIIKYPQVEVLKSKDSSFCVVCGLPNYRPFTRWADCYIHDENMRFKYEVHHESCVAHIKGVFCRYSKTCAEILQTAQEIQKLFGGIQRNVKKDAKTKIAKG